MTSHAHYTPLTVVDHATATTLTWAGGHLSADPTPAGRALAAKARHLADTATMIGDTTWVGHHQATLDAHAPTADVLATLLAAADYHATIIQAPPQAVEALYGPTDPDPEDTLTTDDGLATVTVDTRPTAIL